MTSIKQKTFTEGKRTKEVYSFYFSLQPHSKDSYSVLSFPLSSGRGWKKKTKDKWMSIKTIEWRQAPFHSLLGIGPVQDQWEVLDISKHSQTWLGCPHTPSKSNFNKCSKKKLLIFNLKVNSWCEHEVFLLMGISGCFQVLFYRESLQN